MPDEHDGTGQAFAELTNRASPELDRGTVERNRSDAGIGFGGFRWLSITTGNRSTDTDRNC
jgi:hypothetical protein